MQRLIDADALKECFPDYGEGLCTFNVIINAVIDKQPTIEAEPVRHGKWANDAVGVLHCSECNTQAPWKYGRDFIDYRWESNYCPECGARMDEE